jgi:hypothetical protein
MQEIEKEIEHQSSSEESEYAPANHEEEEDTIEFKAEEDKDIESNCLLSQEISEVSQPKERIYCSLRVVPADSDHDEKTDGPMTMKRMKKSK